MLKAAQYVTLTASTDTPLDLSELGSRALWPSTITVINRGVTIGATESANVAAEIAVVVERKGGTTDIDEEPAVFPLVACPTAGAYLVPARLGASVVLPVGSFSDGMDLIVHLYSPSASKVGIFAEG